jgi:hypothetical protein
MPIFEAQCDCGYIKEVLILSQKEKKEWINSKEEVPFLCPKCNKVLKKVMALTAKGKVI